MRFFCFLTLCSLSVFADMPERDIVFPADHGPHFSDASDLPTPYTEWWYFNGKVTAESGREFGYAVAIFYAVREVQGHRVYRPFAHLQISDLANNKAHAYKKYYELSDMELSHEGLELAYSNNFSLSRDPETSAFRLKAQGKVNSQQIAIDLELSPKSSPFLMTPNGLFDMPDGGNSFYYSIPHLGTKGTIRLGDKVFNLNPNQSDSWFDHQWGDFEVEKYGWEWFSVRLSNGIDANIFLHRDGQTGEVIGGQATLKMPDGQIKYIAHDQLQIEREVLWESPDQTTYPLVFSIKIPSEELLITMGSYFPRQDLNGYYEGLSYVMAEHQGGSMLGGYAYVELVYWD